jgi:hypothetical protein
MLEVTLHRGGAGEAPIRTHVADRWTDPVLLDVIPDCIQRQLLGASEAPLCAADSPAPPACKGAFGALPRLCRHEIVMSLLRVEFTPDWHTSATRPLGTCPAELSQRSRVSC